MQHCTVSCIQNEACCLGLSELSFHLTALKGLEWCRDLVAKEAAEAEKRKEERRRKERKNRDAFTALLRAHLADGRFNCKTRFKVRFHKRSSCSKHKTCHSKRHLHRAYFRLLPLLRSHLAVCRLVCKVRVKVSFHLIWASVRSV